MKKYKIIGLLFLSIIILSVGYVCIDFITQKDNNKVKLSNSKTVENTENIDQEEFEQAVDYFILGDTSLLEKTLEDSEKNYAIFHKELDRRELIIREEFNGNANLYYEYLEKKHNWKEAHPYDNELKLSYSKTVDSVEDIDQKEFELAMDYFMLGDTSLLEKMFGSDKTNDLIIGLILQKGIDRRALIVRDKFNGDQDLYYEYLEKKHNWKETHPDDSANNSTSN